MLVRIGLLRGHQFFQHSMQMRCRQLDIRIFVLAGAGLGGEHRTAMNILEVAIGKLLSALVALRFVVVFPQMPFRIFDKTMLLDEFLFRLLCRPMIGPVAPLIEHALLILISHCACS